MNDRATAEEVVESEAHEIRIRLKLRPEDAELYGTMLTMLSELARARRYVERCQWRVPRALPCRRSRPDCRASDFLGVRTALRLRGKAGAPFTPVPLHHGFP